MNKLLILPFLFLSFTSSSVGQSIVFDTTTYKGGLPNHFNKTDFSLVDTLQYWNYFLDTTHINETNDSIKPIGQLVIWRTKPIDDGISKKLYGKLWTPNYVFNIYKKVNWDYCLRKAISARIFSSCVPPEVGGDIIAAGNFIFLNDNVCLSCQHFTTKIDLCRPVINYLFSRVDQTRVTTLQSLVDQFEIKAGIITGLYSNN